MNSSTQTIMNKFSSNIVVAVILVLLGFSLNNFQQVSGEPLEGEGNVCNITIPIKKDIKIRLPVFYEMKIQTMCGILPCTQTRIDTRYDESIKTIIQYVDKRTCCQGYTETPERKCVPICLNSCNNGRCVSPNVCKCDLEPTNNSPGFVGPTCNRFVCLDSDSWGSKCDKKCNCPTNSYCSANTGRCLCYPGWRGENCTLECNSSSLSSECESYMSLPPIVEPEANFVEQSSARSAKLLLPDALVVEKISEPESISDDRMIFLTIVSLICWVSLVAYLIIRRINKRNREESHYDACSNPDSNVSGSQYYSSSNYSHSTMGRAPTDYFSKNLSMTAAIRNALNGIDSDKTKQMDCSNVGRLRPIITPRIETHLIASQRASQNNVYSEPNLNDSDCHLYAVPTNLLPQLNMSNTSSSEGHIYQVPKSPAYKSAISSSSANTKDTGSQNDTSIEISPSNYHEATNEDAVSNIYEELKAQSPGRR